MTPSYYLNQYSVLSKEITWVQFHETYLRHKSSKISLKITSLKVHSDLTGASELKVKFKEPISKILPQ